MTSLTDIMNRIEFFAGGTQFDVEYKKIKGVWRNSYDRDGIEVWSNGEFVEINSIGVRTLYKKKKLIQTSLWT